MATIALAAPAVQKSAPAVVKHDEGGTTRNGVTMSNNQNTTTATAETTAWEVSVNVRNILAERGMTQKELAARSGISLSSLNKKLRDVADWYVVDVYKVICALGPGGYDEATWRRVLLGAS